MGDLPIEIREKSSEMFIHFCCISIDGIFLGFWAAMNFAVNFVVRRYVPPDGADAIIGWVLQGLFGLATLIPIGIFVYRDIRIMLKRAAQKIAKAASYE